MSALAALIAVGYVGLIVAFGWKGLVLVILHVAILLACVTKR